MGLAEGWPKISIIGKEKKSCHVIMDIVRSKVRYRVLYFFFTTIKDTLFYLKCPVKVILYFVVWTTQCWILVVKSVMNRKRLRTTTLRIFPFKNRLRRMMFPFWFKLSNKKFTLKHTILQLYPCLHVGFEK